MNRVAITGFGVVSPIGVGREAFWAALAAGRGGIGPITRFDASGFQVRLAGEVREPLALPEEAARLARLDPKVGFAFAACREALEGAGESSLGPADLLHLGTSLEVFDPSSVVAGGKIDFAGAASRSLAGEGPPLQVPLDTAARLIARSFGRPARSLTNCSACAAGAQAIGHAFREVRAGRCAIALCGGFDSMVNPLGVGGFQLLGALTIDNDRGASACRPFDASRSGTVLGEGAAAFVLEPLDRALARGKTALAEIVGYASTLDAYSLSAPDPEGDGAARCMRAALADARLEPEAIGHINAHGTGTRLNDEVEAKAIRAVFAETWTRIPVSATKALTGHLIAAAGAAEVGACLLALVRDLLPPDPFLDKVGEGCELDHVRGESRPFDGDHVLTNSFGFGGQNAALILRRIHG